MWFLQALIHLHEHLKDFLPVDIPVYVEQRKTKRGPAGGFKGNT